MSKALIVVDMQHDFLPGGALPVEDGDLVVPVVERLMIHPDYNVIVTTQDWHPEESEHFKKWPVHCVRHTWGAQLVGPIGARPVSFRITKGIGPEDDGYSAFDGHVTRSWGQGCGIKDPEGLGLGEVLRMAGVTEVDVVGLALDYCVRATALDAIEAGLAVRVPLAATRPVEQGTGGEAIIDLREAGVTVR